MRSARDTHHVRIGQRDASSSRSRSRSPSPSSSPNVNAAKKKGRKKSSAVWNHCHQELIGGQTVTFCNHCDNTRWILGGSTSTALYHIKQHHIEKLTADELISINQKAQGTEQTSPSSKLPARSPQHASLYHKISHNSARGCDLNMKLMLAMISSSVSFNILDNPEWGVFVETLSCHQYHLPSRMYMNGTIVPILYAACKKSCH